SSDPGKSRVAGVACAGCASGCLLISRATYSTMRVRQWVETCPESRLPTFAKESRLLSKSPPRAAEGGMLDAGSCRLMRAWSSKVRSCALPCTAYPDNGTARPTAHLALPHCRPPQQRGRTDLIGMHGRNGP